MSVDERAEEQRRRPVDAAGERWAREVVAGWSRPKPKPPALLPWQQGSYEHRERTRQIHVQRAILDDALAAAMRSIDKLLDLRVPDYRELAGESFAIGDLRTAIAGRGKPPE